nr:DUF1127 domain-containing protein [uncultured Pseudomonas sp.]
MGVFSDVRVQSALEQLEARKPLAASAGLSRAGLMLHRWRTRRALLELDDEQLRDIGLSWEQARLEGSKPFWKA